MIADDMRAAADYVYECSGGKISLLALVTRLRAHADLLERIEREMREFRPHGAIVSTWAKALSTGSLE